MPLLLLRRAHFSVPGGPGAAEVLATAERPGVAEVFAAAGRLIATGRVAAWSPHCMYPCP
ncbi:hypothetical protein [Actinoplanes sandaracinus]|uniref:hypothetical protein n=1 Tax=Actinoplanes sandaracinus TaxID=3045177 RepID=UPI0024A97B36|nr:hypothetical protein [Actinoplanes sandaracinus]